MNIVPAGDESRPCVERLLAQSRLTGYIEQTVDKEMGFFRVATKRPVFHMTGKRWPKAPEGKQIAESVSHYNVQCSAPSAATITPVSTFGVLTDAWVVDEFQRAELDSFAAALGRTPGSESVAATVPATSTTNSAPKCIASELPEWSGASAARKKELMAKCRAE